MAKVTAVWIGDKVQPESLDTWPKVNILRSYRGYELEPWCRRMELSGQYCGAADLMRYEHLHKYGGICIDADSNLMNPQVFDFIEQYPNVLVAENEFVRPGLIGTGFMKFDRGHPFLEYFIKDIKKHGFRGEQVAWKATGPMRLTNALMTWVRKVKRHDIVIMPSSLFQPNHFTGVSYDGPGVLVDTLWGTTKNLYKDKQDKMI